MWEIRLRDNREVKLRLLMVDGEEPLFKMFSSMSDEALRWSMAPYTKERIHMWINDTQDRHRLVATHKNRIVGYASMYKFPHEGKEWETLLSIYIKIFILLD